MTILKIIEVKYIFDKDVNKHTGGLDDVVKIILEINEALTSGKVNDDDDDDDDDDDFI